MSAMPRTASAFCPPMARAMTSTTVPRCAPPPQQRVQYVKYTPQVTTTPAPAPYNDEGPIKSAIKLKEGMMKAREKGAKAMAETGNKQSEQQMKLAATELK